MALWAHNPKHYSTSGTNCAIIHRNKNHMKKLLVLALIAASCVTNAATPNWVEYGSGEGPDGRITVIAYYDSASVKITQHRFVTVWERKALAAPEPHSTSGQVVLDCQGRSTSLKYIVEYRDVNFKHVVSTFTTDTEFTPVLSGSIADALLESTCPK